MRTTPWAIPGQLKVFFPGTANTLKIAATATYDSTPSVAPRWTFNAHSTGVEVGGTYFGDINVLITDTTKYAAASHPDWGTGASVEHTWDVALECTLGILGSRAFVRINFNEENGAVSTSIDTLTAPTFASNIFQLSLSLSSYSLFSCEQTLSATLSHSTDSTSASATIHECVENGEVLAITSAFGMVVLVCP